MADNQTVSEDAMQSLATKLAEFSKMLTPEERTILMEQLKQTPADEDVQGFQYNFLYEKFAEAHRAELLHEAEQQRLAASALPPRQPGMIRLAIGRMGTMLVGLGTRLRAVELGGSGRPATRPL